MPLKLKLDDLHLILLSTASQCEDDSVLPVDPSIAAETERVAAALADLLAHKLVAEAPATKAPFWREDGDDRFTLVLTGAGCAAIRVASEDICADLAEPIGMFASPSATGAVDPSSLVSAAPASKTAMIIALMQRSDGATLSELVAATSWLPHTTRAALTGLRKKGHAIVRSKRGDMTCYHIQQAA